MAVTHIALGTRHNNYIVPITDQTRVLDRFISDRATLRCPTELNTRWPGTPRMKIKQLYKYEKGQRPTEIKALKKMNKDFSITKMRPIEVSILTSDWDFEKNYIKPGGKAFISDGAHRGTTLNRQYGNFAEIPCNITLIDDLSEINEQFLAINRDVEVISKYSILMNEYEMKEPLAVKIVNSVKKCGCEVKARGANTPGAITHVQNIIKAYEANGVKIIEKTLKIMRNYWSNDKIETAILLGILEVCRLSKEAGTYNDDTIETIIHDCFNWFESPKAMNDDISAAFKRLKLTKAVPPTDRIADSIIYVVNKKSNVLLSEIVYDIKLPSMEY